MRVRSAPGTGPASLRLKPLLPARTWLYVLDGPVTASNYDWYQVVPVGTDALPSGWVASASQGGAPWVITAKYDCPRAPATMEALAALRPNVGLACFAGRPITVQARIVECNCDVDGAPEYDPAWFGWSGGPLLVPPSTNRPEARAADWFGLRLDPSGEYPNPLPVGMYVSGTTWSDAGIMDVTGVFDHPAAAACTVTLIPYDEHDAVPTTDCRSMFAVTHIAPRS